MPIPIPEFAATLTTILAPFTSYLVEGGKKIAGEAAKAGWEKAQALWAKIQARWGDDKAIQGAAMLVSSDPESKDWQAQLAKALAARLEKDPAFAHEMMAAVGGEKAVQQVIAEKSSWIEDITQEIAGGGKQVVKAEGDSVIKGVRQNIKK